MAGRRRESAGLAHAAGLGYPTTAGGIEAILDAPRAFGVVFDATTARSHAVHWRRLQPLDTLLIDLTPSRIGHMVVPTVTGNHPPTERNVSLISCGGQASIPIAHALASRFRTEYIEVVSTVASSIAGRGTRLNLDEYVVTTQYAVARFSGVHHVKAILNVSPAVPPATFRRRSTRSSPARRPRRRASVIAAAALRVRTFAPGYDVIACTVNGDHVVVTVEITPDSDVLPRYAGNLDIIDSAAILVAELHAARMNLSAGTQAYR